MLSPQAAVKVLEDLNLSQARISQMAGLSQPTISRISSGKTKTVLWETAVRLDALARSVLAKTSARKS